MIQFTPLHITDQSHQLHVQHIYDDQLPPGQPVLMVHGAVENGLIFYNKKGKGLGCYLASVGYDVYVIDLRGRGGSHPRIQPFDKYGQSETISHDLPLFFDFVYQQNPQPLHLIGHSWGGVLLTSMLARFPSMIERVRSQVYFGTKRRVAARNWEVLFKVKLMWRTVAPIMTRRYGYLPAKKLSFGADDETIKSHRQSMLWTKTHDWIDNDDGFDYAAACQNITWPPTQFVAAANDRALGHPEDVRLFMKEANYPPEHYLLLAKSTGFAEDYDHITMLTHPKARNDHFQQIVQWMGQF